jgi:hypothetical protein
MNVIKSALNQSAWLVAVFRNGFLRMFKKIANGLYSTRNCADSGNCFASQMIGEMKNPI